MMEKIETSMSGMEHKLLKKMSALENNLGAVLSDMKARLESLEDQSLNHYSMVRNFCKIAA